MLLLIVVLDYNLMTKKSFFLHAFYILQAWTSATTPVHLCRNQTKMYWAQYKIRYRKVSESCKSSGRKQLWKSHLYLWFFSLVLPFVRLILKPRLGKLSQEIIQAELYIPRTIKVFLCSGTQKEFLTPPPPPHLKSRFFFIKVAKIFNTTLTA